MVSVGAKGLGLLLKDVFHDFAHFRGGYSPVGETAFYIRWEFCESLIIAIR